MAECLPVPGGDEQPDVRQLYVEGTGNGRVPDVVGHDEAGCSGQQSPQPVAASRYVRDGGGVSQHRREPALAGDRVSVRSGRQPGDAVGEPRPHRRVIGYRARHRGLAHAAHSDQPDQRRPAPGTGDEQAPDVIQQAGTGDVPLRRDRHVGKPHLRMRRPMSTWWGARWDE